MQNNYKYHKLISSNIPKRFTEINHPPKQIYTIGEDLEQLLKKPTVSIVGSRQPSPYGKEVTYKLAYELASHNIVIVSGLALGVDSIAHRACLDAKKQTIAVLPCGPDKIYPASHNNLAHNIIQQGGALITEYPVNTPALKQNFIARNRLISALGEIIIVTEAASKSGTLHTANFALDQGKTVLSVPGEITNPLSVGTNRLIQTGAIPLISTQDVYDALGLAPKQVISSSYTPSNNNEKIILELLTQGIKDGDLLLSSSNLATSDFNQTLTMLEINNQVKALGNNQWQIK